MPPSQNLVNFGRQTGLDYVVHFTHLLQVFVGGNIFVTKRAVDEQRIIILQRVSYSIPKCGELSCTNSRQVHRAV